MKKVETGFELSGGILPRMKKYISTGTSVMAIMADPIIEKVLVNASGWNSLPSCPSSMKTGTKERTIMAREKNIALPTCLADVIMTSSRFVALSSGGISDRWR